MSNRRQLYIPRSRKRYFCAKFDVQSMFTKQFLRNWVTCDYKDLPQCCGTCLTILAFDVKKKKKKYMYLSF